MVITKQVRSQVRKSVGKESLKEVKRGRKYEGGEKEEVEEEFIFEVTRLKVIHVRFQFILWLQRMI